MYVTMLAGVRVTRQPRVKVTSSYNAESSDVGLWATTSLDIQCLKCTSRVPGTLCGLMALPLSWGILSVDCDPTCTSSESSVMCTTQQKCWAGLGFLSTRDRQLAFQQELARMRSQNGLGIFVGPGYRYAAFQPTLTTDHEEQPKGIK